MRAEPADIALLACILNGDERGLAALLNRHWHTIVRYSFSILDDWDAAEDVAEEVFVKLWEHRETWGLEGSVRGLLFRIARNLSLDDRRQQDARARASDNAVVPGQPLEPTSYLESKEIHAALLAVLANLPQRRRDVYVLVRHHGLSYREVADALGLAPQTVANHLSMALADLRDALSPYLYTHSGESMQAHLVGEVIGH